MKQRGRSGLTALDWIGATLALLGVAYVASFPFVVAPGFRGLLDDFGGTPPALTRVALTSWFPLALAVAPAGALVASVSVALSVSWRRALIASSFAVSACVGAMLHYALFLPILSTQVK